METNPDRAYYYFSHDYKNVIRMNKNRKLIFRRVAPLGFDRDVFKGWLENNGFTVMTNKIFSVIEKEHNSVMKKYPMFLLIGKKN